MHTLISSLIAAVLIGLAAAVAILPSRTGLTITLITLLVIPSPIVIPNPVSSLASASYMVTLALLIRLIFEVRAGQLRRSIFAVTPLHTLLLAYLLSEFLFGIVNNKSNVAFSTQFDGFITRVQFVVVFITVLAAVRAHGSRALVKPLVVSLAFTTTIALYEYYSKQSFWHHLAPYLADQQKFNFARVLEPRANGVRVRGSSEFAVEFAWYTAALIPVGMAYLFDRKRGTYLISISGAAVAGAIYWSGTRSVLIGLVVALVGFWAISRSPKAGSLATLALIGGIAIGFASPTVQHHFSSEINSGSIQIRGQRNSHAAEVIADTPFTGLGIKSETTVGLKATDADVVAYYVQVGALGTLVFLLMILGAILAAIRVARVPDPRDRTLGAAFAAGALVIAASSSSLDAFALGQTSSLFFVFVAGALVISEEHLGPIQLPRQGKLWRYLLPLIGGLVGSIVYVVAPTHATVQQTVFTVGVTNEGEDSPLQLGEQLLGSICTAAHAVPLPPHSSVECTELAGVDAVGRIVVRSDSLSSAKAVAAEIARDTQALGYLQTKILTTKETAGDKDTYARVAPLVGLVLGALAAISIPTGGPLQRRWAASRLERRRSRRVAAEDGSPVSEPVG